MIGIFITLLATEEDRTRFSALYEKYRKLMFFVANDILKDVNLAEDAVQEAFLRIVKNFDKIGDVSCSRTKAFVVIITRNIALTMVSKANAMNELNERMTSVSSDLSDNTFENVSYRVLVKSITELPQIYRDVLFLAHIYGYNYSEISELLSISVEAVKKRVQRGKEKLRSSIEEGVLKKSE